MKTLYLLRHAKSEGKDDPSLKDFDRPLSERGEGDAPAMGALLKKREVNPDVIISSPANRALTTARLVANEMGYPEKDIQTDQKLYHADDEVLLDFIRSLPDQYESVMIAGHNPGLTDFANNLLNETIDNIPTAGVIESKLEIVSWKNAVWRCGKMIFFDFP